MKSSRLLRHLWASAGLWLGSAHAQSPPVAGDLAADPAWLRLGHYSPAIASPSGWLSEIHSDEFFLDPAGRSDPRAELAATLRAFAAPVGPKPDTHAQCRFPGRWLWLKAHIPADPAFERRIDCPAFTEWTRAGGVTSLSIVFATGYLGNPASYYGHTLLKFNFRGDVTQTRLMDVSVNYGAIVGKQDDVVTYIVKSVLGGYDGGFSHIQFYYFNHDYGENDLRDLWEYELVLPQETVDLIVAHAWEVLGKRYTYGFFRRNCAYRMAELLEVADGLQLMPDRWPWIIPQALTQQLGSARYRGAPLLGRVTYLPSRQSRFYEKYRGLSAAQVAVAGEVVEGRLHPQDPAFTALPAATRAATLDALLDYYQFVGNPLDKAPAPLQKDYVSVLSARFQLEPGAAADAAPPPPSPHLARGIGWIQLGTDHYSAFGQTLALRLRPAHYDPLDASSGHVGNSSLVMGDTQLELRHGRSFVSRVDVVGIDSANPGLTGLPGDSGRAWKLHVGAEQARLSCDDCLVGRVQGDMGYGRKWTPAIYSAAYVGAALQNARAGQGLGFARVAADLIWGSGERLAAKLAYEQRLPVLARTHGYGVAALEARWAITPQTDLRVSYRHDGASVAGIGIGAYW